MLIILDRGDHPNIPLYGLGPARDMQDALAFAAYTVRQNQRIIESTGIPAAMFSNLQTFRSVTTGRASSNTPNMSAGSVRNN